MYNVPKQQIFFWKKSHCENKIFLSSAAISS